MVLAVGSLYYYLAPKSEAQKVAKSLVRISRSKYVANLYIEETTIQFYFYPYPYPYPYISIEV